MPGLRGASVLVAMTGILALTGCQDASGTRSASGTPSSPQPSVNASVAADTPSNGPATTTTTPSPSATATPSPSPSATATPTNPAAITTVTPSPTAATPAGTVPTPASRPGCQNLTVSNEVKAAVTGAYQRSFPRFTHIRPVPRQFFYGQCDGVRYAATRFEPTPGATHDELVAMQDEGSVTKYFRTTSGGNWTYIAGDAFPRGPLGCGHVPQIPEALVAAWGNCSAG